MLDVDETRSAAHAPAAQTGRAARGQGAPLLVTLFLLVGTALPGDGAAQSWASRIRQGVSNASQSASQRLGGVREAVRQRSREAAEAVREQGGHVGERIRAGASSASKQLIERAKQAAPGVGDRVRGLVGEHGSKVAEMADSVMRTHGPRAAQAVRAVASRYGTRAATELRNAYAQHGPLLAARLQQAYDRHGRQLSGKLGTTLAAVGPLAATQILNVYGRCSLAVSDKVRAVYDRHGEHLGLRISALALRIDERYLGGHDASTAEKVLLATVHTASMYNRFDAIKRQATRTAIRTAAEHIPIKTADGRVLSLSDFAKEWVPAHVPVLAGTSIAQDPVEALTYIAVFKDTDYMLNEMKVVRGAGGEFVAPAAYIAQSSPLDAGSTLAVIDAVEGFSTLADGEAGADDIVAAAALIQAMPGSGVSAGQVAAAERQGRGAGVRVAVR